MKYLEKHPMIMIVIGIFGISLSSIFVKYAEAPSAVTAAFRLLWTVVFLTPVVFGKPNVRKELLHISPKLAILSALSGLFLAIHFVFWFESLNRKEVETINIAEKGDALKAIEKIKEDMRLAGVKWLKGFYKGNSKEICRKRPKNPLAYKQRKYGCGKNKKQRA